MKSIKRVIVSGGGTGGHIYPAISIYKAIKEKNPNVEVLYIGTNKGLEAEIVPKAGIPFKAIEIQGLKRSLSLDNVKALYLMVISSIKAWQIVRDFKPDVVIGTGGYACAPVLLGASLAKIPTFIHEQNSVAGVTNKFLARFVNKIGICFEDVRKDFGKYATKCVFTGNPRAQEILEVTPDPMILESQFNLEPTKPTVLIFGGSRGAPAINKAAIEAVESFVNSNYQVIIATGTAHYDALMAEVGRDLNTTTNNVRIVPYIENMPKVFQAIDLVVCRSGATTLTELTTLGLPSILIPSPYVTNNHQEANARSLVDNNAAMMIRESEINGRLLHHIVDDLIDNPVKLLAMANSAKKLGTPHAKDDIMSVIEEII